jgi:hypothetical protein
MPDKQLYQLIAENFELDELKPLCRQLHVDYDDLSGSTKTLKVLSLQDYFSNRVQIHDLLAEVHRQRQRLNLKPYLYLVIAEQFAGETEMVQLLKHFGIEPRNFGGQEKFAWGSEPWRLQKAEALQKELEGKGQVDQLLQQLKQRNESLDLAFYTDDPSKQPATSPTTTRPQTNQTTTPTTQPQYENFDINITKQAENNFTIQARYARGGEATAKGVALPLTTPEFTNLLGTLATLSGNLAQAKAAGALMREQLLPAKIWTLFVNSLTSAKNDGKQLRLRLRIEPPEIGMLPWEYAYDEEFKFLAMRRDVPVVRYIEMSFIPEEILAPRPTRILLAGASPKGWDAIDVEGEAERIRTELQSLVDKGDIQIKLVSKLTWDSLQFHLNDFEPHVLHFIGHGSFDVPSGNGAIVLEDEVGDAHEVHPEPFANLIRGSGVKVVILNACKTAAQGRTEAFMGIAPALVQAEIPAVIAMQFAIPQKTALRFAKQLYTFLAMGRPLDRAITETRINISGYDPVFWAIPVLFMRSPDGVIWQERS